MKAQPTGLAPRDVLHRLRFGAEPLGVLPAVAVRPVRFDPLSTVTTAPSIPARTSEGRQIRVRNSVRRRGAPTSFAKIGSLAAAGHRSMCSRTITTSHGGRGIVRRPAADFGKGLNAVCPATPP